MTSIETQVGLSVTPFVGGKWLDEVGDLGHPIIDPATEEVIGKAFYASIDTVDTAVKQARDAFDNGGWARAKLRDRIPVMERAYELLLKRRDEMLDVTIGEMGSPIRTAAPIHVDFAIYSFRQFLDDAPKLELERPLPVMEAPFGQSALIREPVGVVVAITPFNASLLMAIWKLVPALLMGNSVLLKPAPQTPFGLRILVECLAEAGLPTGVLAYLPGDREVGEALTTHPDVDMVSFTGSSAVGEQILETSASTFKRVTLELGGKSPAIIRSDADMDEAIDGVIFGCFIYAGQVCTAGSRVLVQKDIYQSVVDRLAERVRGLVIGSPRDANTDIGPLIRRDQIGRLTGFVARAVVAGARVNCGGRAFAEAERGFYFEPTVVSDVTNDMEIAREELFGPVVVVLPYEDDEDALRIANDTPYGLSAAIWTRDLRAARKMARRLRAGTVWINEHHAFQAHTPFGGMKHSGLGREGSEQGFYNFTETKHLFTSMAGGRRGHFWPLPKLEKKIAGGKG